MRKGDEAAVEESDYPLDSQLAELLEEKPSVPTEMFHRRAVIYFCAVAFMVFVSVYMAGWIMGSSGKPKILPAPKATPHILSPRRAQIAMDRVGEHSERFKLHGEFVIT